MIFDEARSLPSEFFAGDGSGSIKIIRLSGGPCEGLERFGRVCEPEAGWGTITPPDWSPPYSPTDHMIPLIPS